MFRSHLPTILIVIQPSSELNFSYSSFDDLNLIKLVPFGKVIFRVGLLSGDINVTLPECKLILSIAISGSSTPWPHKGFNSANSTISLPLKSAPLNIKSTL